MKAIERGEVLGLAEYERVRDPFRSRVIAQKKLRRVAIGPRATAVFENRDTVLLQIQEMLRTERITRPGAIEHEIATYNELLPGDDELSVTLMIEIADKAERDAFLAAAVGLERHVCLVAGSERVAARSVEHGAPSSERTTAVHYLKFSLPPPLAQALRAIGASGRAVEPAMAIELLIDHPAYTERGVLSPGTLVELGQDLAA
jgi:hypothetical protein